jgi:hypothetical protein
MAVTHSDDELPRQQRPSGHTSGDGSSSHSAVSPSVGGGAVLADIQGTGGAAAVRHAAFQRLQPICAQLLRVRQDSATLHQARTTCTPAPTSVLKCCVFAKVASPSDGACCRARDALKMVEQGLLSGRLHCCDAYMVCHEALQPLRLLRRSLANWGGRWAA